MKDLKIKQSSNYNQFSLLKGNREIKKSHVRSIEDQMKKHGFIPSFHIIVNNKNEIVDGQHRWMAAKNLNIPFFYTNSNEMNLKDAQSLNSTSKKWGAVDYAKSYAELGFIDYEILLNFMEKHNHNITNASQMLTKRWGDSNAQKHRDGSFKVIDLDFAEKVAEAIELIAPSIPKVARRKKYWVAAIGYLLENTNFNPGFFAERVQKCPDEYEYQIGNNNDIEYYIGMVNKILSWNRRSHKNYEYKKGLQSK